ncbi:hypothetical protein FRC12_019819, partial [Ceratobasidium sp. 428]
MPLSVTLMFGLPLTARLAARSLGSRCINVPGSISLRSVTSIVSPDNTFPAATDSKSEASVLEATRTPTSFAERAAAAQYDRPPITPFSDPESLTPTPLPTGTQLPATADPLLDFTAALLQKHGERTKAARIVTKILDHIHIITG